MQRIIHWAGMRMYSKNPHQKMSFAQAFAKGLYEAEVVWFVTRTDYDMHYLQYDRKRRKDIRTDIKNHLQDFSGE